MYVHDKCASSLRFPFKGNDLLVVIVEFTSCPERFSCTVSIFQVCRFIPLVGLSKPSVIFREALSVCSLVSKAFPDY